jgi:hypothetical protein
LVNIVTQHIILNGIDHHYYTRFILPKTELWCFTVGMGEQSVMMQLGKAFLKGADPELGRVMLAMGVSKVSEKPFKGDFNVWWGYDNNPDFVHQYLEHTTVKPDLALACSNRLYSALYEAGLNTMMLPYGVGEDFKPLGLPRAGCGYVGGDSKSLEQKQLILAPFLNRPDFEWRAHKPTDKWLSANELNEWYNHKQVVFGLSNLNCSVWHQIGNRIFETYASGTPIIFPRHPGFMETFGFPQPYPVDKVGDVERWVNVIQKDYPKHVKKSKALSMVVRSKHMYKDRLEKLFNRLKEMRK